MIKKTFFGSLLLFWMVAVVPFQGRVYIAQAVSPSTISNLTLWLDAGVGVTTDGSTAATDGQLVQQWNDQSGAVNNAVQLTSGNRPTYKTNIFNGQRTTDIAFYWYCKDTGNQFISEFCV